MSTQIVYLLDDAQRLDPGMTGSLKRSHTMDNLPDQSVNVRDLREHLADYLGRVRDGATLVVMSHGQPVARLVPVEPKAPRARLYGAMKDRIWIASDFDEADPDTIAAVEADLDA
jgi:prevent-host-death family protein